MGRAESVKQRCPGPQEDRACRVKNVVARWASDSKRALLYRSGKNGGRHSAGGLVSEVEETGKDELEKALASSEEEERMGNGDRV